MPLAQIYLFFICASAFFSCNQDNRPDVSDIKMELKINRFDKDLYAGKEKNVNNTDAFLAKKYGRFYEDFVHQMVGNPNLSSLDVLQGLYKDSAYEVLNKEVDSVFPNLQKQEEELTETFKYIKYYYPKIRLPQFVAFLSGFSYQIPIGDGYFGIGLDMFLGKDSKFYGALTQSIPRYLSNRFTPAYIVPRVTEYYIRENLVKENDHDKNLLSKMIYNGKILYFLDQVLPTTVGDSTKIGYTTNQLAWCKAYEGSIWAYYLENNYLYETDYSKIQVFLSDGPFTPGLGEKNSAAPKLGIYTGWQIVRKYMKENPEITLTQLMKEPDAQKILTKSTYKPKDE